MLAVFAGRPHGHVIFHSGRAAKIFLRQLGKNLFSQHVRIEFDDQPCNLGWPRLLPACGHTPPPDRIGKRRYGLVDRPRNERLCHSCAHRVAFAVRAIIAAVAKIAPGCELKTTPAPTPRPWAVRPALLRMMGRANLQQTLLHLLKCSRPRHALKLICRQIEPHRLLVRWVLPKIDM